MADQETITMDPRELAKELGPAADAPIGPWVGVASIALNMAMKYHDISTIQDGALYQQYKLEGRNIRTIGLDDVFETAVRIEKHLIKSHKRIAVALLDQLTELDAPEAPNTDESAKSPAAEGGSQTG